MVATSGSVRAEDSEQRVRKGDEHQADDGGDGHADPRRVMHARNRALGMTGTEILPGDRCRRTHQADRGPRDHREQLGVANRIRRLRCGALLERAHETQHQHAADVHGDALHAGRQAETEERLDDRPVGPPVHVTREANDAVAVEQVIERINADRARRDRRCPSADPAVPSAGIGTEAAYQERRST